MIGSNFLARENDMYCVSCFGVRAVKKHMNSGGQSVNKTRGVHCDDRAIQIDSPDEHIDVLRISNGRLVDGCDPDRDGVFADHRVIQVRRFKSARRSQ